MNIARAAIVQTDWSKLDLSPLHQNKYRWVQSTGQGCCKASRAILLAVSRFLIPSRT